MRKIMIHAFSFIYVVLSAFFGIILPSLKIFGVREITNIPFGFVYGVGWWGVAFISNPRDPFVQFVGALVSPIVVMIITYIAMLVVIGGKYKHQKGVLAFSLVLFIFCLPLGVVHDLLGENFPTYYEILNAVY